jgi:hypothetical protein
MKSNLLLWSVAGLFSVLVIGMAVYRAWPVLFPEIHMVAPLDPDCDLRAGPCTTALPGGQGTVTLSIKPRSIPVVQPLQLQVDLVGLDAKQVQIDFSGVDMNMGFNRPSLENQGDGHFHGHARLPVCVRDAMEWEARVLIQTDAGLVSAPYRFITVKPGRALPEN